MIRAERQRLKAHNSDEALGMSGRFSRTAVSRTAAIVTLVATLLTEKKAGAALDERRGTAEGPTNAKAPLSLSALPPPAPNYTIPPLPALSLTTGAGAGGPEPASKPTKSRGATNTEVAAIGAAKAAHIAVDAVIATFARLKEFESKSHLLKWTFAIAATHTVFPMVGFLAGWEGNQLSSFFAPLVCASGVIACYKFLKDDLLPSIRGEKEEGAASISADPSKSTRENNRAFMNAVWLVSIDALYSGVITTSTNLQWSGLQAAVSFPYVGALVGGAVLTAGALTFSLKKRLTNVRGDDDLTRTSGRMAASFNAGVWAEVGIFNYFGAAAAYNFAKYSALALGAGSAVPAVGWIPIAAVAGLNTARLYRRYSSEVRKHQANEAREIVGL